jgi:uncharacterized membrane protein (UPF0127 family)
MRFPIDLVYYDRRLVVNGVVLGLRPWRLSPIRWAAAGASELPAGSVRATHTLPDDQLAFRTPSVRAGSPFPA